MQEHIEKRGFQQGRELDGFARGSRAGEHEDAAADDGAHAQRGEAKPAEGFLQPSFGLVGVGDELIDTLRTEKLWVQSPPSASDQEKLYLVRQFRATARRPLRRIAGWRSVPPAFSGRNPGS